MKYEIMFIVRPNLEDADLKKVVKGFEDVFTRMVLKSNLLKIWVQEN